MVDKNDDRVSEMQKFFNELNEMVFEFSTDADTTEEELAEKLNKSSHAVDDFIEYLGGIDMDFEKYVNENFDDFSKEEHKLLTAMHRFAASLDDLGDELNGSEDESDSNPFRVDDDTEFE